MKINKVFAAIASAALSFSAIAAMAISANAEEIKIDGDYSKSAIQYAEDGKSVIKDIYNANSADTSILGSGKEVKDYVTVKFTVGGIGTKKANVKEDMTEEDYVATLVAKVNNSDITAAENVGIKKIEGDGAYELRLDFSGTKGTLENLIINTNIDSSQFKDEQMTITITDILTDQETTTTTSTTTTTTTTTTTSTASAGNSTTASTTTSNTTAAPTGDAGVGVAVAVAALAGTAAFVARKKD